MVGALPHVVRRVGVIVLVATALALAATAAGATATRAPSGSSTEAQAEKQATRFITLLQKNDLTGLKAFLSPAFQLQRADGTFVNKAEYLQKPSTVGPTFHLDNVRATRAGDVIVARFDLEVDAVINGQQQSTAPAPRLAVFVKGPKGWQLAAYANFNTPAPPS
jgi:hypothetical protein